MAINIKELFVTDLNPNSSFWWSRDKVDKINYNFDQLSNGGTPGPQGTIGVDGGFGPVGTQGYQGFKGPQGFQGFQGAESLNDWVLFPEADGLPGYLYPRKNPVTLSQVVPVALRIGYINNPSLDSEYGIGASALDSPSQVVKVHVNGWSNLRVEENNNVNGYNFSFRKSLVGNKPVFTIFPGITDSRFKIIWTAKTTVFKTGITSFVDAIKITDSQITINTGGSTGPEFTLSNNSGNITKSENQFRFTPNAAIDKVLVSTDGFGNVEWKDVKEVFGTFPIGSIISIRPSDFVTANFWLDDSISATLGSPLNNIYGRGKLGTDYEGWYLCNGETWETEQGFNQTLTPNLNNFTYTIDANGDAQYAVTSLGADATPIILGGYDMRITAIPNSAGVYDVGYTTSFSNNDTSPGNNTINMGISGSHYTSRMIHIVYLGLTNLKWTNSGSNIIVPPPTTNTITLTAPLPSSTLCSSPVTTNYSWTGNNDWNTFAIPSTYKLFNFGTTTYAPSGWYINADGYPINWNSVSGSFISRGITCPPQPTYTPNLRYSLLVDDLNGPLPSTGGGDIYLDMSNPTGLVTSLDQATSLSWSDDQTTYPTGTLADAGWYRDINTGVRRYWNGIGQFEGASFTQDWVNRVYFNFGGNGGVIDDPGYNNASSTGGSLGTPVCSVPQTKHVTYVAGDAILVTPVVGQSQNIRDYQNNLGVYVTGSYPGTAFGTALYVPLAWEVPLYDFLNQDIANTPPLINVADQYKPGSTTLKYSKVYLDNDYWASITQTAGLTHGKIGTTLGSC